MPTETSSTNHVSVDPRCHSLLEEIEAKFQESTLPGYKWYLTTLGTIIASSEPHMAGQLYLYLLGQHPYSTVRERRDQTIRFHEVILEATALLGILRPAEAMITITSIEPDDAALPFSQEV